MTAGTSSEQAQAAIVLLSGGLDSTTALAWALDQGYHLAQTLSFTYGQRHVREVESAKAIAAAYGVPHAVVALAPISGSPLTGAGSIPQGRKLSSLDEQIAPTYVPNRNMIFLSYAAAYALLGEAHSLIGGWNLSDTTNYPDCRAEFLFSAQETLRLATLRDFRIICPLMEDTKEMLLRRAIELQVPLHLTWTCYLGEALSCGTCDACSLRIQAFQDVGVIDPLPYAVDLSWPGCTVYERAKG